MAQEISICHDYGAHPSGVPHGPWWLTVRIPLGNLGHIYLGAATGRNRFRGRFPFLRVSAHRWILRRPYRPDLLWSMHRQCAHINVSYSDRVTKEGEE